MKVDRYPSQSKNDSFKILNKYEFNKNNQNSQKLTSNDAPQKTPVKESPTGTNG